jgi:uncharacterized circularly permuted ATP-grasp superfamily protein/uncharacterized alpha-E superfamily protein
MAAALASAAEEGHFDELRGRAARDDETYTLELSDKWTAWQTFFEHLGADGFDDLDRRTRHLARQIRDNGVSYNVYADADNPQRPWSLDLFPLIVAADSWRQIEAGVLQRVQVLEAVMADVYGPRALVRAGLLPTALVRGHPGYLRSMHGVEPAGGTFLPIVAFDLARGPDGHWWVVSQRTQAPSGLGYLLENRLSISRLFPQAFEAMSVQRLAGTYRALIDGIKAMSPAGADAHIALLTPGPYNETYFEHAYLARYLGISLVQGTDLTVRDDHLYLRTLRGLEPIHGLIKRVDDAWLDPLELRPDSTLGVAGLLQAVRSGHVVMANAPGSAFLESSALLGFLPALADHLLGETLRLPALPTWWCGERAVLDQVLPRLGESVIKPTYPGWASHNSFEAVLGRQLPRRKLDEWAGRILRQGDEYTVQRALPLSQMPTWRTEGDTPGIAPRSAMLRVFALADGPRSWRVLPGGLVRIVGADAGIASMQRGGSSADAWVLTTGAVDRTTLLQPHLSPASISQRKRLVTSRAAENLFWLGRYTERTENCLRLARITINRLNGEDAAAPALLAWLGDMAMKSTLVLPGVPSAVQARRVFERSLIASLDSRDGATSVGYNLRALKLNASSVRERLSQEHWSIITRAESQFSQSCAAHAAQGDWSAADALRTLEAASNDMAAITGAQTDRMTRDDGWRLLSIDRLIERLCVLAPALASGFQTGAVHDSGGFEALVALFDSTITFHAQYQQSRDVAALVDLLVLDRDNPRSLGWVVKTLRGRLAKLAGSAPDALDALARKMPDPADWMLAPLCTPDADDRYSALAALLSQCLGAAWQLSEDISLRYFTHTFETGQSLGA